MRLFELAFVFMSLVLATLAVQAGTNTGFSYQGRIVRPSGEPANSGVITFSLKILDATNNCTVWSETQSMNMTGTQGTFSLVLGAGTRTDGGAHTFKQVFVNAGTLSSLACGTGTTSTPGASDDRNLDVTINDGGTVVSLGSMPIKSVPFAMQADQVSGYGIMNLAKISGLGSATSITGIQFDFLANLAAPASASATPCIANDVLKYVGGVWTCAAAGAGTASTSGLTAAIATNTIDNANYAQTWNWTTATTESPMSIAANSITTGSLFNLTTSSAAVNSTNGLLNVANTSATTTGVLARFQANSTAGSGLTVLANGNVGIGTTSPQSGLDVFAGGVGSEGDLTINAEIGNSLPLSFAPAKTGIGFKGYYTNPSTFPIYFAGITGGKENATSGNTAGILTFSTRSNSVLNTERMRITSAGNVGIGTAGPAAQLHVVSSDGASAGAANANPAMTVVGGAGNAGGNGNGGSLSFTGGGASGTGAGGDIAMAAGSGSATSGTRGGNVTISAGGTSYTPSGSTTISGGGYSGNNTASYLSLTGSGSITTGGVTLSSGPTTGTVGSSGSISIITPDAAAGGNRSGGGISLAAGTATGTASGGAISITAGGGGATNVNGSNIVLNGGSKGGTGADGNVILANTRGNVGIGTAIPQTTLDVNGVVRVAKYASQPFACDAAHDSSLAITSGYRQCICKGGATSWVFTSDGITACTW